MRKRKIILSAGVLLILVAAGILLYRLPAMRRTDAPESKSVYKVLPGDPEWEQLGSVEDKIRACSVDEDILRSLTDEELVQAVLDYPFLIDLFAADDSEVAVQSLRRNSDAFQELLFRENAKEILLEWVRTRKADSERPISAKDEIQRDEVAILLMYTDELKQALTEEDMQTLSGFSSLVAGR